MAPSWKQQIPTIAIQMTTVKQGSLQADGEPPAKDLKFSRSSFMMFMIAELIAHAFSQLNNPRAGLTTNSAIPRRLAKIILTISTATPSREQNILKKRAKEALDNLEDARVARK